MEDYLKIVKQNTPVFNKFKRKLYAFIVGGFIGLIGEVLINLIVKIHFISYTNSVNIMMIILIFSACVLTGCGFFDYLVTKFGGGLFIPITGFAHATSSSALEYKKEGLVFGIGSNFFKLSGSVILYGVIGAYVSSIIKYIIGRIL